MSAESKSERSFPADGAQKERRLRISQVSTFFPRSPPPPTNLRQFPRSASNFGRSSGCSFPPVSSGGAFSHRRCQKMSQAERLPSHCRRLAPPLISHQILLTFCSADGCRRRRRKSAGKKNRRLQRRRQRAGRPNRKLRRRAAPEIR